MINDFDDIPRKLARKGSLALGVSVVGTLGAYSIVNEELVTGCSVQGF